MLIKGYTGKQNTLFHKLSIKVTFWQDYPCDSGLFRTQQKSCTTHDCKLNEHTVYFSNNLSSVMPGCRQPNSTQAYRKSECHQSCSN